MLVAPVLAILAWLAVDYFVAERPQAAEPGAAYALTARSNCRYASGQCDLVNADFEFHLRAAEITPSGITLELSSKFALQQATIELVDTGAHTPPSKMKSAGASGLHWAGEIPRPGDTASMLRVAVVSRGATYYAEVPLAFIGGDREGAP